MKVLFLASNPASTERVRIDREVRLIRERLLATTHADCVQIVARWAVRLDDLLQALLEVQPHIVHFSGHGTRTQEILLEDETGRAAPVPADALAGLLGVLKDRIGLVVLNACYSQQQAEMINRCIEVTIGMGRSVSDEAAVEFAATLYQAIGFGRSLQTAFDLARKVLECKRIPGSDIPQLFARPGVNPRHVVFVDELDEPSLAGYRRMAHTRSQMAPPRLRTPEPPVVFDAPRRVPIHVDAPTRIVDRDAAGERSGKHAAEQIHPRLAHPPPQLAIQRPHPIMVAMVMCSGLAAATCVRNHSPDTWYTWAPPDAPKHLEIEAQPPPVAEKPTVPAANTREPSPSTAQTPRSSTLEGPPPDAEKPTIPAAYMQKPSPSTVQISRSSTDALSPVSSATKDKPRPSLKEAPAQPQAPASQPSSQPSEPPHFASGSADCNKGVCMLSAEGGSFSSRFVACLGPVGSGAKCSVNEISSDGATAICDQRSQTETDDVDGPTMWRRCSR